MGPIVRSSRAPRRRFEAWKLLGALSPLVASCGPSGGAVRSPPPALAASTAPSYLSVTYREPANVFEVLDNVSSWLPEKCDGEYRAYWQKRFGITAEDEQRFASYRTIRERYYPLESESPKGAVDLFGRAKAADRVADAFYGAPTLEAAFAALAVFATAADVTALRAFVEAFRPKWELLAIESRVFVGIASDLQVALGRQETTAWLTRLAAFYGVSEVPRFTVLLVWWPPVDAVTANTRGQTLLLKYNPERHMGEARRNTDVPIHEVVHWVSSHQSAEQRTELTKVFLARCDVSSRIAPVRVLEEPFAVAQQKVFVAEVDPKGLTFASAWYGGDPWVGTFAKLLFPILKQAHERGQHLDAELMKTVGKTCAQLNAVAAVLKP